MSDTRSVSEDRSTDNSSKGNLVEDIVAMMHEGEGVTVETRVLLPTIFNPKHKREIDVLVTSQVSGYPVRIAVECKNYANQVTHVQIDEFAGKLEAVGIPSQHGIFVTVHGFNDHALAVAATKGIQTFVLDGLNSDRITTAIWDAFQVVIYLQSNITEISLQSDFAIASPDILTVVDSRNRPVCLLSDVIWSQWKRGQLPQEIGEHSIPFNLPANWGLRDNDRVSEISGSFKLKVVGLLVAIRSDASKFSLIHADGLSADRIHIASDFENADIVPEITAVDTEEDLQNHLKSLGLVNIILGRTPLPRTVMLGKLYWPPSEHAISRVMRNVADSFWRREFDTNSLQKLGFRDIEGYFLDRAFDPISPTHPASSDEDWPILRNEKRHVNRRQLSRRTRNKRCI